MCVQGCVLSGGSRTESIALFIQVVGGIQPYPLPQVGLKSPSPCWLSAEVCSHFWRLPTSPWLWVPFLPSLKPATGEGASTVSGFSFLSQISDPLTLLPFTFTDLGDETEPTQIPQDNLPRSVRFLTWITSAKSLLSHKVTQDWGIKGGTSGGWGQGRLK